MRKCRQSRGLLHLWKCQLFFSPTASRYMDPPWCHSAQPLDREEKQHKGRLGEGGEQAAIPSTTSGPLCFISTIARISPDVSHPPVFTVLALPFDIRAARLPENQMNTQITICMNGKPATSRNEQMMKVFCELEQCARQMSVCSTAASVTTPKSSPATLEVKNSTRSSQAKTRRCRSQACS